MKGLAGKQEEIAPGQGLIAQFLAIFSGPWKALSVLGFLLGLVAFLCLIVCLNGISKAASLSDLGLWLAGFVLSAIATASIKIWFWIRMSHVSLLGALKAVDRQKAAP